MASKIPTVLTAKTPYEDMILYDNGRFANFTRQEYEGICQRFRKFDVDESNSIDLFELQLMMESIGETKTHAELKAMIAEVDKSKDGTISFTEFLSLIKGPEAGEKTSVLSEIYRQPKNRVFEEAAAALKENPDEAKARVKKEYEERKKEAALKAEAEAIEAAEREAAEKARQQSKQNLAERLKAFEGK